MPQPVNVAKDSQLSKVYFFQSDIQPLPVQNKREVYWPKSLGGRDYYDPSLRRTFRSKQEMRAYMAQHKLRDAGERVNPEKHINGRQRASSNPQTRQAIQAHIQQSGGVDGLLHRIQTGRGRFV